MSRLLIATAIYGNPKTGSVTYGYHSKVRELERGGSVIIPANLAFYDDLVRGRSRCVWWALEKPDWDWVLWWDDDVVPENVAIVARMIQKANAQGYEVLGAPYPKKIHPVDFPYVPLEEHIRSGVGKANDDVLEVQAVSMGFCLTSRTCLVAMVNHYAHEWFTDMHDDLPLHRTIALFKQVHTEPTAKPTADGGTMQTRDLLSEDYSFMWRWKNMGGRIGMYVGEGTPLGHIGGHKFMGAGPHNFPVQLRRV